MLLISTTIRDSSPTSPSGSLHLVDLENKKLIDSIEMAGPYQDRSVSLIPPPKFLPEDPNQRGGLRGLRGIAIVNSKTIAIANTVAVYIFDTSWNLQSFIEHPSCAGIHDIVYGDNGFWITSTLNDLLLKIDFSSQIQDYFYFREHPDVLSFLSWQSSPRISSQEIYSGEIDFRDPKNCSPADNLAHLNSICQLGKDDLLISLGFLHQATDKKPSQGNFVILRKKQDEAYPILAMAGGRVPNHSLKKLDDTKFVFCDTNTGHIVQVCLNSHEIEKKFPVDNTFLRGLCVLDKTTVIAGSGAYVYWLNLSSGKITHRLQVSSNPKASVFDIAKLPSNFTLFPEHLKSN